MSRLVFGRFFVVVLQMLRCLSPLLVQLPTNEDLRPAPLGNLAQPVERHFLGHLESCCLFVGSGHVGGIPEPPLDLRYAH
jgi:hypothetical protein